ERLVEDARGVLVLGAGGEVGVQERRRLPPERLYEAPAAPPGGAEGPLRLRLRDAGGREHLSGHGRRQTQANYDLDETPAAQRSRPQLTDQRPELALFHEDPPRHDDLCQ